MTAETDFIPQPEYQPTDSSASHGPESTPPGVDTHRLPRPAGVQPQLNWRYLITLLVVHLLALLVLLPWFFTWSGVAVAVIGVYVMGGIGINLCYHRLLTHRSFACPRWLERAFTVVGACCLEDAPASWVAAHRLHHRDSDHQPDPHTPLAGFLWSHVGWLLVRNDEVRSLSAYDRYARDILRDPFYFWLQRGFGTVYLYLAHASLCYLAGVAFAWLWTGQMAGAWRVGASWVVWGVLLRTVIVWHISWSVNSLTHVFGYRNYETNENSRNNWLIGYFGNGEGWHNNHHAQPASASNWHRWWEFDSVYLFILALERMGLAWDVIRPRQQRQAHG